MAQVAQDTFVADLESGPLFVAKGAVFADGHEVVKLDAGRGLLFQPLDLGEEEPAPPKSTPAKAAPAAAAPGKPHAAATAKAKGGA